jgi:asparagine synthase (glutamine-hydrolysing)
MAECMWHHSSYAGEFHTDAAGVGLGRLRLEFQEPDLHPAWTAGGALVALVDGEIYDAHEQRLSLRAAGFRVLGESPAELLAKGYAYKGKTFFRGLHGKFTAVIWDRRNQQLVLVNDRFGMRPLYYAQLPERLLFAAEIKGLLANTQVPRQANLRGIAQFFTFGQLLGQDTFIEGIQLLPAASVLTYHLDQNRIHLDRYWRLAPEPVKGTRSEDVLDQLDHTFADAVRRTTAGVPKLGLSLSGGVDSRTILGVVDDHQPLTTVSIGMPGSADHRSAAAMARLTNRPHHQCLLGDDFLDHVEQHLRDMVRLTDGHYLSQCIVMPTLQVYRELGIRVLLRGHAGELMHMAKAYNYSLSEEDLALSDSASIEKWLLRQLPAFMLEGAGSNLFAAAHRGDIAQLARQSLRDCLEESKGVEPPVHRIWHMFINQRLRRETAMSLVKFGSVVQTRLPYLDNELVDTLFAAPPQVKLQNTVQTHILQRRRPSFLKVLNVNTGAAMDAGPVGRFLGKARHKMFAKLGVRGYQPYERLGLWLRRELRPLVEKLLLADESLERGIFEPAGVKGVVHAHLQGKNHTYLILAMMVFEMGQRITGTNLKIDKGRNKEDGNGSGSGLHTAVKT